jgi:dolichol-phosphate mannosyltransferase
VEYTARRRIHGKPWYSFRRNLTFAKTGILAFSIKPLKYIGYLGIVLTMFAALALLVDLGLSIYAGGWYFSPVVTLTIFNILLFGVVLISLGVMALYLSYIYYNY